MLEHDYIQMLIEEFTRALVPALRRAFSDGDTTATSDLEAAASDLLGFSPEAALALSPETLVSFAQLSNVSESVAAYAAYALDRAADAHALAGDDGTAEEQLNRWRKFCNGQVDCVGCPCNKDDGISADCFAKWAQMSYEEGGTK